MCLCLNTSEIGSSFCVTVESCILSSSVHGYLPTYLWVYVSIGAFDLRWDKRKNGLSDRLKQTWIQIANVSWSWSCSLCHALLVVMVVVLLIKSSVKIVKMIDYETRDCTCQWLCTYQNTWKNVLVCLRGCCRGAFCLPRTSPKFRKFWIIINCAQSTPVGTKPRWLKWWFIWWILNAKFDTEKLLFFWFSFDQFSAEIDSHLWREKCDKCQRKIILFERLIKSHCIETTKIAISESLPKFFCKKHTSCLNV